MKKNTFDFQVTGYTDMELSTQILIREARSRGIKVEVLDRSANFIRLSKGSHIEYIKEATKTRLDSYATFLIMENKLVTKRILAENGLRVPRGGFYTDEKAARADYSKYAGRHIVVKPNNTNFGIGVVTVDKPKKAAYFEAVKLAFEKDKTVIIEEFLEGKEYRFLVLGKKVVAVMNRVPANVIGDGKNTISKLVEIKNHNPLRGKGYKTPLEKLQLGEVELLTLKQQGLTADFIPAIGQQIFIRYNSNISTGGDSVDVTDQTHPSYMKIALQAARAVSAAITGADIIIRDLEKTATKTNYGIIELNFNPVFHIHAYPYQGTPRNGAPVMLDLLGF